MFRHEPLADGEIRLVSFEPDGDLPIRLKLEHVRLEKHNAQPGLPLAGTSAYFALSYAWGSGGPSKMIEINGAKFLVNENLYLAMEHIRELSSHRAVQPIWIDAICIKQEDAAEKAAQVVRMKEIYEKAYQVIIWLGAERPLETRLAVNLLAEHVKIDIWNRSVNTDTLLQSTRTNRLGWRALGQDLLKRDWWKRMWVIQEVAVSQRAVIMCGLHLVSWTQLEVAERFARGYSISAFGVTEDEILRGDVFLANVNAKSEYRLRPREGEPLPILELLMNNLSCQATDPRDMIYSLTSLATDVRTIAAAGTASDQAVVETLQDAQPPTLVLSCDYSRPVEEVYIQFAKTHAVTYRSLDIICFSRTPKHFESLPSWVPDWSNARDTLSPNIFSYLGSTFNWVYHYNASRGLQPNFKFGGNNILEGHGIIIDTVQDHGRSWVADKPPGEEFYITLRHWRQVALGDKFEGAEGAYVSGGTNHTAFIRTITADQDKWGRRTNLEVGYFDPIICFGDGGDIYEEERHDRAYERSKIKEGMLDDLVPSFRDMERAAYLRVTRRRFFKTAGGHFGLGNPDIKVNDKVVILSGCSVPVILREAPSLDLLNGPQRQPEYEFVGESFILGLMDGEAVNESFDLHRIDVR